MREENDSNLTFVVKDSRMVREVKDATGIVSKTYELFKKDFNYLYNSEYINVQQKADLRQQAIERGLLPREAQGKTAEQSTTTTPPAGTYS